MTLAETRQQQPAVSESSQPTTMRQEQLSERGLALQTISFLIRCHLMSVHHSVAPVDVTVTQRQPSSLQTASQQLRKRQTSLGLPAQVTDAPRLHLHEQIQSSSLASSS